MFKFLKRKIKKFEDELENELKVELDKDEFESVDSKILDDKEQSKKQIEKSDVDKKIDVKLDKKEEFKIKKDRRLFRKGSITKEKQRKDEEFDKQIEKSIESELKHTLETRKSIEKTVKKEGRKVRGISEDRLDDLLWDLEIGLLESDVAYNVIESIKKDIKEEIKEISFDKSKVSETIENILRNAISHVLKSSELDLVDYITDSSKPVVIMFVGVNGSGKTLSIAKIATLLKEKGLTCVMAAGDTFRAGAIEQLGIHAENLGVKIVKHGSGADPAAVAYDAIEHAKAKHKDVVLLDTAGRMQTNINLMDEMAKIKRVAKPNLIIFVGDALAGNDAVDQAKRFNEIVGIDGVILTKVDTDAKGGSALSVAYTIGKPLLFIGIGQGYSDQIPFDAQWMINNIFSEEK
jgi:fused signal recognition particle receptor